MLSCAAINAEGPKWKERLPVPAEMDDDPERFRVLANGIFHRTHRCHNDGSVQDIIFLSELGPKSAKPYLESYGHVMDSASLRGDSDNAAILWNPFRFELHRGEDQTTYRRWHGGAGYFSLKLHDKLTRETVLATALHLPAKTSSSLIADYSPTDAITELQEHIEVARLDVDRIIMAGDVNICRYDHTNRRIKSRLRHADAFDQIIADLSLRGLYHDGRNEDVFVSDNDSCLGTWRAAQACDEIFTHRTVGGRLTFSQSDEEATRFRWIRSDLFA